MDLVAKARSAIGHGVRYGLGCGGLHPEDDLPAREILHTPHGSPVAVLARWCDCSGFIAWVLGRSRKPWHGTPFRWWLATNSIHDDAVDEQMLFEQIPAPEPGCLAVYPDAGGHQGHVAIVVDPATHTVIDCSGSHDGVSEHLASYFWNGAHPTVWCRYKGEPAA